MECIGKLKVSINDQLFFFQAEDGIRNLVRSRGLGDVYKGQAMHFPGVLAVLSIRAMHTTILHPGSPCL